MAKRIVVKNVPGYDHAISFPGTMGPDEIRAAIEGLPGVRRDKYTRQLEGIRKKAAVVDQAAKVIGGYEKMVSMATPSSLMDSFVATSELIRGVTQDAFRFNRQAGVQSNINQGRIAALAEMDMRQPVSDEEIQSVSQRLSPSEIAPVDMTSTKAALRGQALPEEDLNVVQKGLSDVAGSAMEVAASVMYPAGAPFFFGAGAGVKTLGQVQERDDLNLFEKANRVLLNAGSGAVAPGLGQMGMRAASRLMQGFIKNGQTWATSAGAQRAVEALAANGLQQPMEFLANAPDFMEASPEDRTEMAVRMLIGNVAFALPDVIRSGPTQTQADTPFGERLAVDLSRFMDLVEPEASPLGGQFYQEKAAQMALSPDVINVLPVDAQGDPVVMAGMFGRMVKDAAASPEFRNALRGAIEARIDEGYVPPLPYREFPPEYWSGEDDVAAPMVKEDPGDSGVAPEPVQEPVPEPDNRDDLGATEGPADNEPRRITQVDAGQGVAQPAVRIDVTPRDGLIRIDGRTGFDDFSDFIRNELTTEKFTEYRFSKEFIDEVFFRYGEGEVALQLKPLLDSARRRRKDTVIQPPARKSARKPANQSMESIVDKAFKGLRLARQKNEILRTVIGDGAEYASLTDGRFALRFRDETLAKKHDITDQGGFNPEAVKTIFKDATMNLAALDVDFTMGLQKLDQILVLLESFTPLKPEGSNAVQLSLKDNNAAKVQLVKNKDGSYGVVAEVPGLAKAKFGIQSGGELVGGAVQAKYLRGVVDAFLGAGGQKIRFQQRDPDAPVYLTPKGGKAQGVIDSLIMPLRGENRVMGGPDTPAVDLSSRPAPVEGGARELRDAPASVESRGYGRPKKPEKPAQWWLWPDKGSVETKPLKNITIHGFDGSVYEGVEIYPLEFPEAMRLLERMGVGFRVKERIQRGKRVDQGAHGIFQYKPGMGQILMPKALAENPDAALQTFLHELGHAHEWFDYQQMVGDLERNLVARVGQLNQIMLDELPLWPGSKDGGMVNNAMLHDELWRWTQYWKPIPAAAFSNAEYIAYRKSAVELYADFVSGMLVAPEKAQLIAPVAHEMWLNWMDAKPAFKRAYEDIQSILRSGKKNTFQARIEEAADNFGRGYERHRELARIRKQFALSKSDSFWLATDATHYIRRKVEGVDDPNMPARFNPTFALDEMFFNDAQVFGFVSDIKTQIFDPLGEVGLGAADIGTYLMLSRIAGNPEAWARYKDLKRNATDQDVALLDMAARSLRRIERYHETANDFDAQGRTVEADRIRKRIAGIEKRLGAKLAAHENGKYSIDDARQWYYDGRGKGTRADIWNPQGYNPATAQETLAAFMDRLDPDQQQAIMSAARHFRRNVFDVVTEAHRVGLISAKAWETIKDNRDWYAAFRPIEYINRTYVSPAVKRATGSVSKIENPLFSTAFKMVPTLQAIAEQKAKILTKNFFRQHFPDEFVPVKSDTNVQELQNRGYKRLEIYVDGVAKPYYVHEGVARAFDFLGAADIHFGVTFLNRMFRSTIYPFIISYSEQFIARNPVRDVSRTLRNLKPIQDKYIKARNPRLRRKFLKNLFTSYDDAYQYFKGNVTPDVREMLDTFALASPLSGMFSLAGGNTTRDILFNLAGETPPAWNDSPWKWVKDKFKIDDQNKFREAYKRVKGKIPEEVLKEWGRLNPIELVKILPAIGAVSEVLSKIAAYKTLKPYVDTQTLSHIVREYAGTPNYRRRGTWTGMTNAWFPFTNVALQGYAADSKLAFDKKSAGSYWIGFGAVYGPVVALYAAALSGLLGEELEEWAEHIGPWDLQNYINTPMGMVPGVDNFAEGGEMTGKRAASFRTPINPSDVVPYGLMMIWAREAVKAWKGTDAGRKYRSEWFERSAQHLSGVLPTMNNIVEVAAAGMAWVTNTQHTDWFTGRNIFSNDAQVLGHGYTAREFGRFMIEKLGFTNVLRYNIFDSTRNLYKEDIEFMPFVSAYVKYTDSGIRDLNRSEQMIEKADRAWIRQGWSPKLSDIRRKYWRLRGKKKSFMTPTETRVYNYLHKHIGPLEDFAERRAEAIARNPKIFDDPKWRKWVRDNQERWNDMADAINERIVEITRE